jgi:hypothetical protein
LSIRLVGALRVDSVSRQVIRAKQLQALEVPGEETNKILVDVIGFKICLGNDDLRVDPFLGRALSSDSRMGETKGPRPSRTVGDRI